MPMRLVSGRDPDYKFIKPLGSGGMGTVAKVRRVRDYKDMACKTIDCSSSPEIYKYAQAEVSTLAAVSENKHIAKFSDDWSWNASSKMMRLYMDFYKGGDLQSFLDHHRHEEQQLHPVLGLLFALNIAQGVGACHTALIIHRDLKPANILLRGDFKVSDVFWAAGRREQLTDSQYKKLDQLDTGGAGYRWPYNSWDHSNFRAMFDGDVVISDFGLGKFSAKQNTLATYSMMGTPGYIPPESIGPTGSFSSRPDIFSLGWLLYALFSGRGPTSATLGRSEIARFEHYPAAVTDIVKKCLESNPSMRPCIEDVIEIISSALDQVIQSYDFKGIVDHMQREYRRIEHIKNPPDTRPEAVKLVGEMSKIVGRGLSRFFS